MPRLRVLLSVFVVLVLGMRAPAQSEQPRFKLGSGGAVRTVAFSPDGKVLASGDDEGIVRILDPATGKEVHRLTMKLPVQALVFAHDGKTLAVKNPMSPFTLFETAKWTQTKQSPSHNSNSTTIAFNKAGDTLLGAAAHEYEYWEPTRGSMSSSRSGGAMAGAFAAVSPDGQIALWGQPDGYLQLIQPRGGVGGNLRVGRTNSVAFAPDGKSLATANADKTVRMWDWTTQKELRKLGLGEEAGHVVFSGDGKLLLTVGKSETVLRLFDVASSKELRQINGSRGGVVCVALSADGKLAATGSADGRTRIWDLAGTAEKPPAASNLTAKDLAALYGELSNADPATNRKAFATLLANPKQSVPFLHEKVKTTAQLKVDSRVTKLIAELDSDDFEVREAATEELTKMGEKAAGALRQALTGDVSFEVRSRINKMLKALPEQAALSPEIVRVFEAIELLEQLATPDARAALQALARESLDSRVMREVRGAVERLPKQ